MLWRGDDSDAERAALDSLAKRLSTKPPVLEWLGNDLSRASGVISLAAAFEELTRGGYDLVLSFGPGAPFADWGRQQAEVASKKLAFVPSLASGAEVGRSLREAVAALYVGGVTIDWQQLRDQGMTVHIHTEDEIAAMKAAMLPAFNEAWNEATEGRGAKLVEMIQALGG